MTETWLPVPNFPGYEVSDMGRVRSIDRYIERSNGVVALYPGVLRKLQLNKRTGYLNVMLRRDGKFVLRQVHGLVLQAFVGPAPEGMECCHGPGGPTDNRVTNLRWDTRSANNYDRVADGHHFHANKTHCDYGHEFTVANTRIARRPDGRFLQRICRACVRRVSAERRATTNTPNYAKASAK